MVYSHETLLFASCSLPGPRTVADMAPHLTAMELDKMSTLQAAGRTPIEIAAWLAAHRRRKGIVPPNLTAVRRVLHGQSYRRGQPETRVRKRKLSQKQVRKLNQVRKSLLKKAGSESKVTYQQILRVGRVARKVSSTTLAKNFKAEFFYKHHFVQFQYAAIHNFMPKT